jgi:hypothetical protein
MDYFVKALCEFDERMVGSAGHFHAQKLITMKMKEIGLKPYNGESFDNYYEANSIKFNNIIGKISGSSNSLNPILITAHYDTCDMQPGADDNAAAIAIMFYIAEYFMRNGSQRDIIIATFDAEEPPYYQTNSMGCVRFYHDQRIEDIDLAIVMDLVGHDTAIAGLEDTVFVSGFEGHKSLEEAIMVEDGVDHNLKVIPVRNEYIGNLSDHYAFNNRIPYLFYSCGLWKHYHKTTDTPEKLTYKKMKHIAESIIRLIKNVGSNDLNEAYKQGSTNKTINTEKFFYEKYFGDILTKNCGIIEIENKKDIKKFIDHILLTMNLAVF